ncbi:hypothetical protein LQF61_10390 [Tetragenococcus koreensis]|uniref:hypothetical protein n=1 Tax=Tetragenococcus koreensis TaxID=290335 RepID=UPI001F3682CD|nr:hypothetical protein [Tetragenococcus koreensis]MCF1620479.1 hypothetical protein [Tetragenococcus koreensis]MCF1657989.1 hypothetical protein [Tetragenococcus koreensis]
MGLLIFAFVLAIVMGKIGKILRYLVDTPADEFDAEVERQAKLKELEKEENEEQL